MGTCRSTNSPGAFRTICLMGSIPFAQHNKKSLLRQVKIVVITKKLRIADFDLLAWPNNCRIRIPALSAIYPSDKVVAMSE